MTWYSRTDVFASCNSWNTLVFKPLDYSWKLVVKDFKSRLKNSEKFFSFKSRSIYVAADIITIRWNYKLKVISRSLSLNHQQEL